MRRWSASAIAALVIHAAIIGVIAWHLLPEHTVRVSGMVPAPDAAVELMPAQAIEPAVFFTSKPEFLNAEAAKLYRIEDDGSKTLISSAHLHAKRDFGIQFDAVFEPGLYEIVVHDGSSGIVREPNDFDGDFAGVFPSGDGESGGAFSAQFRIEAKAHEVMTATMYDPDKPMENEEPAAKAAQLQKMQKPVAKTEPPKKPETPKKKSEPKKAKSSDAPKSPAVAENMGPVETSPQAVTDEPSPAPLTMENLRISPLNLAPALLSESASTSEKVFEERDTNKFVAAAELAKKRNDAAYNAEGPVVGIGRQGNSLAHKKDVAEYLALMHKEIHPLWAHGYLLRLDTIYRQPGSRLNNPDLEAVLEITLDSLGNVIDVRMVRSSGITDYDSEAIHVAWNSSPKMPIPDEMRSPNGKAYIHWTFWRDQRQCGVFGVQVFKLNGSARDALNFSLKAVQIQEKKLGLQPSVVNMPGIQTIKPTEPEENKTVKEPLPERINPLDDI